MAVCFVGILLVTIRPLLLLLLLLLLLNILPVGKSLLQRLLVVPCLRLGPQV
jgi:hypothetical protein